MTATETPAVVAEGQCLEKKRIMERGSLCLGVPLPFPGHTFPSVSGSAAIAMHATHESMISSFKEL